MALTFEQKSSVRRHLQYPVAGLITTSPAGGSFMSGLVGYRFFQAYGQLEYKMNNLMPDEEARLVGLAYAAIVLTGSQPTPGDTITVVISGGNLQAPVTLTVTAPAGIAGQDMRLVLCALLASACASNAVLQAAGVIGIAPFGAGPYAIGQVPTPGVAFTSPIAFTVTAAASAGATCAPQVTARGAMLTPTASLDGGTTSLFGYLPILDGLESAYAGASDNMDTMQAAVWKGRSNELGLRMSLYKNWQGSLSDFLGIPVNRDRRHHPSRSGAIRYA